MEITRHASIRLSEGELTPALHLPLYLRLMLGLLLGIVVIVAGVVAFTHLTPPPANPFAAYDDLIAGDALDPAFGSNYETLARAAFDLACTTSVTGKTCLYLYRPETGPFEVIQFSDLNVQGDSGVYFSVRDNALTIGDLVLLWGRPTITQTNNWLILQWPDQRMSTVVRSDSGQFSYFLPVPYLLLAANSNGRISA